MSESHPAERRRIVVIGAGQAGLSAAHGLRRAGLIPHVDLEVLDANPGPGGAWSHRWDALTFDRAHGLHDLPGFPLGTPDPEEPAREVVKRYYGAYEDREQLEVLRPWRVTSVERTAEPAPDLPGPRPRFLVTAQHGAAKEHAASKGHAASKETRTFLADAVISATGTWDKPFIPTHAGHFAGRQLTTRGFVSPDEFTGQRVLVVGGGASAAQFIMLLRRNGVDTVWSTRTAPRFTEQPFGPAWGRGVEHRVSARVRAGLPPLSVVAETGLQTDLYREGIDAGWMESRGAIRRLLPHGVVFADGTTEEVDAILWATGFRASLDHLAPLRLRTPGGGIRMMPDDVSVASAPGLALVGYGPSASTLGATRAGRKASRAVLTLTESN
ncbi:MAG: flavin-containing monooxygenase [Galactobacter sp.]|uniref:flavin-containing monooxygenase n=1 Tax=Galactobacter sp. TaxID=2676125 RepID=UPI0025C1EFA4|nr:NAD(P)/FAD-dependent oxidoreductase [Galactobacter sp.]